MDDLVTNWSIDQVGAWLASKGFDSFRNIFKEEGITGDVLIHLDHECLSEMHMNSVGKRVLFMKAVYELKVRHNLPIYPEDYQPPTAQESNNVQDDLFGGYSIQDSKVIAAFKERDAVIKHLVQEVSRLASEIGKIRDEIRWSIQPKMDKASNLSTQAFKNFKNRPSPILTSSTKLGVSAPSTNLMRVPSSPLAGQEKSALGSPHSPNLPDQPTSSSMVHLVENVASGSSDINFGSDTVKVKEAKAQRENDAYKHFRISPEDPSSKVILAILKKYKISEHWQNYSLYISQASGEENKLDMDDLPLLIYQKLKDANKSPTFTIKHNIKGKVFPLLLNSNTGSEPKEQLAKQDNQSPSKGSLTPTSNSQSPKLSAS